MTRRYSSADARRRILSTCVRLFVRQGYKATRMSDIMQLADVSTSTFHNIFGTKDGVLAEIMQFVFAHPLDAAGVRLPDGKPAAAFAVRSALLLTIAEQDECFRELCVKSCTLPKVAESVCRHTTTMLHGLSSVADIALYERSIGATGILCAYTAHPCDQYFSLTSKLTCCLQMMMESLRVPHPDIQSALDFVAQLDICTAAASAKAGLYRAMEREFNCRLGD